MRRMNLLPPELRPRDGGRRGSSYMVVGALAAAIIAMVAYGAVIRGVRSGQSDLASFQEETEQAEARAAALSPYAVFAEMKQTRDESVRVVAETRFDYERLTRELARILPEGVSVTHLEVGAGGPSEEEAEADTDSPLPSAGSEPTMTLTGCAPTQDAVADTLDRLRALTSATAVTLGSSGTGGTTAGGSETGDEPYLVSGSGGGGSAGSCGKVGFDVAVTLAMPGAEGVGS